MEQAQDPTAAVRALTGWTPFFLEPGDPEPVAHWLEIGPEGFLEPFFERTIERRSADPNCRVASTKIRALELLPRVAPCLAPSGFIFHTSRAGSTLLANALKACAQHLVICEATPINQMLSWPVRQQEPAAWQRLFQGLVACLGQAQEAAQERFFIKLASHNLLEIERILNAFPGVPWVVLYRDPLEVLASALARPPRWLRLYERPNDAANELGLEPSEIAGLSRVDYAARILTQFCENALGAAGRGGGLLVNYRQLSPAALQPLGRHFGLDLCSEQLARMAEAFKFDAKSVTPRPFVAETPDEVDPALSQACAGSLEALYDALEARRTPLVES